MPSAHGHRQSQSISQNQKAQLANAYNELGKELSSTKIRVVGNYTLGKVIGEGAYGKVRLGTHRLTSTRVAIKQIPKDMSASLTREIHHHRQLHHPHITQMYEVIATESYIWIVTELCCGGELFDYLAEKGRLSEDDARRIFGQLCLAVAYLHDKGIVHRDLKLENVLLDEMCRVKLGDFGFTREFDKNVLLETFCGTTGYASPEMLEGKKYTGPEVDVWSLGVILYCLLTGTLPFDDDDEGVMRQKIIGGHYESPEWLSQESRDLLAGILTRDTVRRYTIPQILAHPWFANPPIPAPQFSRITTPEPEPIPESTDSHRTSETSNHSNASHTTFLTASSEMISGPATPDDSTCHDPPHVQSPDDAFFHPNPSEVTLTHKPITRSSVPPETVTEEDDDQFFEPPSAISRRHSSKDSSKFPPLHPRTPARTKRRSVSSTLSDHANPQPFAAAGRQDYAALLTTPTPIIFSTQLERELLNSLSTLGFDTGQIVHSVLSEACDASGALWWIMKRKAERRALEETETHKSEDEWHEWSKKRSKHHTGRVSIGIQTSSSVQIHGGMSVAHSAPQLSFVPPTPTGTSSASGRPTTPPTRSQGTKSPMLSPSSTFSPSPSGSVKEGGSKGRKNRAGSVSIMQRATTALEAAGLVKKKSSEAVRDADKDKDRSKEEKRTGSNEEQRLSHGSSSKLLKSPRLKAAKDKDHGSPPSTPPPVSLAAQSHQNMNSPWVEVPSMVPRRPEVMTPANTPNETPGSSVSNQETIKSTNHNRNRASILNAFKFWLHEDKKSKRKETYVVTNTRPMPSPIQTYSKGKRRGSSNKASPMQTSSTRGRSHRASVSSRRSSSVNSRRSSITSTHMVMIDTHFLEPRRSAGTHTPNSERGDYPSRPSSIQSFTMQPRHRKSPSASSASSAHMRSTSPLQSKYYHRRGGSGSSTRVVRQPIPTSHGRSNSTTSSLHSPTSSRPPSFYEDVDSTTRTGSPFKTPRRASADDATPRRTTFVAHKRQAPFMSPSSSLGRSSWKKAWGLEPPGWQTRTAHLPIEIVAISPADSTTIRDVISGRQSLSLGDDDDWVDEEDDIPVFAGGLGQMALASSTISASRSKETSINMSPAPRGSRKRGKNTASSSTAASVVTKGLNLGTPLERRASPIGDAPGFESSGTANRRQLPSVRSGPAFRGHAIQEEDEEEEE